MLTYIIVDDLAYTIYELPITLTKSEMTPDIQPLVTEMKHFVVFPNFWVLI